MGIVIMIGLLDMRMANIPRLIVFNGTSESFNLSVVVTIATDVRIHLHQLLITPCMIPV